MWSRRTCVHFLLWEFQNCDSLLNNHRQENVGSYQKKIHHIQGQKRNPIKMVGGAKSCLESNPTPTRDVRRAQTNFVRIRTQILHRNWARTLFECLLQRYGSAVAFCRGRGSGCSKPGYDISPLEGGRHDPHHRATTTYTDLGKQTLGGHKQNLVHTRTQRSIETETELCLSVSCRGTGQQWPSAGAGALGAANLGMT